MEDNFEDGMSWKNYGEWEIDHIISLAKDGQHCVNNLQPMWKSENRHKYTKIIPTNKKTNSIK
jgi:5-methylcytosine-specific restriction endonuclease McrA